MFITDKQQKVQTRIVPTMPREILALMLGHIRESVFDGSVETAVFYAQECLERAGLTEDRARIIGAELDALLDEGYANAAQDCLEEARLISAYTDVDEIIRTMYDYLRRANINAKHWLDENGSSREGVKALRKEGRRSREKNLVKARLVSGAFAARVLVLRIGYESKD
jgi:hypothetical protein